MEPMLQEDYLKNVYPVLMKVFNDSIFQPSGQIVYPFSSSLEASLFLCAQCKNPFDTQVFWNTLRNAALNLGDTFIYEVDTLEQYCHIISLEQQGDCTLTHSSWQVKLSPSGAWGLHENMEGFSFLGGSQSFINSIRQACPEIDDQFFEFLTAWKSLDYATDDNWLPEILLRIFGDERAKELLEEARKMDVYVSSTSDK
ncbi:MULTISPECIES: hypothetical protein [Pseudanabaena]|uniref:Uncharacterized protein n=2 Tax=Pseudanabaena TaxID=1152 RepID=L8MU16_9CYAN|nr:MULTISPECIES: hypothetical protein [Pseudanabaena]ELS31457.1 hypothetical protein Pse7429DRAFT_3749 [Pseudanabaena biceps PCC 7429]MDG3496284.1 hypothetical protein [Pseudanabaena catenata USMAC16]